MRGIWHKCRWFLMIFEMECGKYFSVNKLRFFFKASCSFSTALFVLSAIIFCEVGWAVFFSLSRCSLLTPDFLSRCAWMSNVLLLFLPIMGSFLSPCLSSLLPISLTACRSSSPAYNWIWVWDRGPVGSQIKEGRLSLHIWWGRQISQISFLL